MATHRIITNNKSNSTTQQKHKRKDNNHINHYLFTAQDTTGEVNHNIHKQHPSEPNQTNKEGNTLNKDVTAKDNNQSSNHTKRAKPGN
jgi:hypothetical protein